MKIRKITSSDLPALAKMVVKVFREPYQMRILPWLKESFKNRIDGACLMAEEDGSIAGAIFCEKILSSRSGAATVREFFVASGYRGRGSGRALLAASLAPMKKKGMKNVSLLVREKNARALTLYKKAGFQPFRLMLLRRF